MLGPNVSGSAVIAHTSKPRSKLAEDSGEAPRRRAS